MIDMLAANSGRVTNLTRVTYIVMDEADRMFDLGKGQTNSTIGTVLLVGVLCVFEARTWRVGLDSIHVLLLLKAGRQKFALG